MTDQELGRLCLQFYLHEHDGLKQMANFLLNGEEVPKACFAEALNRRDSLRRIVANGPKEVKEEFAKLNEGLNRYYFKHF